MHNYKENKQGLLYEKMKKRTKMNPYHLEEIIKARTICEEKGDYIQAYQYEIMLDILQNYYSAVPVGQQHLQELDEKITEQGNRLMKEGDPQKIMEYQKKISYIMDHMHVCYGLIDNVYGYIKKRLIGTYYEDAYGNRKYNAVYSASGLEEVMRHMSGENDIPILDNWVSTKLECQEVTEQKKFQLGNAQEYLLPILSRKKGAEYKFIIKNGQEILCRNAKENHFNYYRVPSGTQVESDELMYIGNPIALEQKKENKKLVLNIFLDGLSQKILEEDRMQAMPYTGVFFKNGGVVCDNVYAAGEWTYPSIANYVTGLYTTEHMMFHSELSWQLPQDVTLLQEYFKQAGYQTAKIDGEWRSTQSYGYGRGMDRMIYQHQSTGMRVEQVVADVLDHMKLMKETNQFIWMCIGDLHDIADGFEMIPSVQGAISIEDRAADDNGTTSVKQSYSTRKKKTYLKVLRHIDEWLRVLYQYIEENYKDEEILISLFGDHGQGYFIKEEEHFLSDGRSKVGMMFRGGFMKAGVCHDLISTCDYITIMCKLAGITMHSDEQIDGQLPVFFGGDEEREYAITDSIHPGDHYMAAIVSKEYRFYLTSENNVGNDGRVKLGNYQYALYHKNGETCIDQNVIEEFMSIITRHMAHLLIKDE